MARRGGPRQHVKARGGDGSGGGMKVQENEQFSGTHRADHAAQCFFGLGQLPTQGATPPCGLAWCVVTRQQQQLPLRVRRTHVPRQLEGHPALRTKASFSHEISIKVRITQRPARGGITGDLSLINSRPCAVSQGCQEGKTRGTTARTHTPCTTRSTSARKQSSNTTLPARDTRRTRKVHASRRTPHHFLLPLPLTPLPSLPPSNCSSALLPLSFSPHSPLHGVPSSSSPLSPLSSFIRFPYPLLSLFSFLLFTKFLVFFHFPILVSLPLSPMFLSIPLSSSHFGIDLCYLLLLTKLLLSSPPH
ncbi:uncharacterized protein LOC135100682 isoform X3 [Scylla paramamosain]|uniref:uncharacterized protein LOC135100682 isoform X3 n=1 Tax=Scylla paramamosain TaxID=85552 RepID=UPI0030831E39